jgi:hypothetical protein
VTNENIVYKKQYNPIKHKRFKKFGEVYVKNKKFLIEYLSNQRLDKNAPTELTHPKLFLKNPQGVSHYMGNPNIKAAFVNVDYTKEQLLEFQKCSKDPLYFTETYIRIMSVDFGLIPFTLYQFQRNMVTTFNDNRFAICKLPRQSGKSTTSVAYILWYLLFHPGKTVGILANKGELAQEMLGRLATAYESLPFWLQQGCVTYNKRSIELENGSKVIATASSGSAARGMSFSLLFLDEFAFVPPNDAEDFFRSVYPTISSGSDTKMIVVSTPKGMNHFYKMWMESTEKRSKFVPIEINWSDIPGRDDDWRYEQISNTSEDQFRQEFECQFIGSSNTLIAPSKLGNMTYIKPSRTQEFVDFYEDAKIVHQYIMCVDSARGVRLDYSAFVVVDITAVPYKLVAKFRSNEVSPMIFPNFIVNMARYYNNAWVLIEVNDVGMQVAVGVQQEFEYENILSTVSKGRSGFQLGSGPGSKLGVTTSHSVKTNGCSNLKSLIEADKMIIEDYEVYVELTTFVRKSEGTSGSFEAESGCNDDLVMCLVLFAWAAGTEYWKELTDTNAKQHMYKQKLDEIEEEVMPIGFLPYDSMLDKTIDSRGDVWSTVDELPELPSWYNDVYRGRF